MSSAFASRFPSPKRNISAAFASAGGRALLWSLAVSIFVQAGTFTMNLLLARVLGKNSFGEWATVQNTVGTVSGIAQLSMAVTAMKFVAQYRDSDPGRVGAILGLCSGVTAATGSLAASFVFVSAPWLAASVLHAPDLTVPLRISVIILFLLTVNGFQMGALSGLERFRALAVLGAIQSGLMAVLVPLFALRWAVSGALGGYALALLLTWVAYRRRLYAELAAAGIRVTYQRMREQAGLLWQFALPATLSGIGGMIASWLSTVILATSSGGYGEMASLAAAMTLRNVVLFAPNIISRVASPMLANDVGRGAGEYRRNFRLNLAMTFASAAAVAVPLALLAPFLLGLFGHGFREASPVVVVMAISAVVEAVTIALSQQFLSHNLMWPNLFVVLARGLVLVLGTYSLVPGHAALGAAAAILLAYTVHLIIAAMYIVRSNGRIASALAEELPPPL